MPVFDRIVAGGHEQVVYGQDAVTGLRAIIAVHSTRLGPALGGVRFRPYAGEDEALVDVLRLSRGMTFKAAAAGLDLGGGKAVILGDPSTDRSEALLQAYGRFVDSLGGRYLTAEDVGTTQADMDIIRRETRHVTGGDPVLGGSGDPSEATAVGVRHAMRALAAHCWGEPSLRGRRVCISGVGKVGHALALLLAADGVALVVADVDRAAVASVVEATGAGVVEPHDAHRCEVDIFSPCALGAVLDHTTIPQLACEAVVGSANNQLATDADAARLAAAGVTYVPDFVASAGGIINIAEELRGYDRARALANVARIGVTTATILGAAVESGDTTTAVAERLALARIEAAGDEGRRMTPAGR